MQRFLKNLLMLVPMVLGFVSCQSSVDIRRAYATYPDAVTNINQVAPAYRAHFRAQHAPNFSRAEQRRALLAAIQTARTPVPRYMPSAAANPVRRRVVNRRYIAHRGRATAQRGRSVARRGQAISRRALAVRGRTRGTTSRRAIRRRR